MKAPFRQSHFFQFVAIAMMALQSHHSFFKPTFLPASDRFENLLLGTPESALSHDQCSNRKLMPLCGMFVNSIFYLPPFFSESGTAISVSLPQGATALTHKSLAKLN
jgi:hypothetical protein